MSIRSILVLAVLVGCAGNNDGGESPRQACEDTTSALCERIYACLTPEELSANGLPANEAACVTSFQANEGCAAQTTDNVCTNGNAKYSPSEASECIDQVHGLTCSEVRDPNFDQNVSAPACAKVCQIPS
jgi:hypothetical protein